MTKELLPTTNKKFIKSINRSLKVTKALDKQLNKTTKSFNKFIKPISKSSKLAKPFAEMKKQVTSLNQALATNNLNAFQAALASLNTAFSEVSSQSLEMMRSLNQVGQSYNTLKKFFSGALTIDDTSIVGLDSETKNLIQSFGNIQMVLKSLKSELAFNDTSLSMLVESGRQLSTEFMKMNQTMSTFNGSFSASQSTITSFSGTMSTSLSTIEASVNKLVASSEKLGLYLANAIKEPSTEVQKSQNIFQKMKDNVSGMLESFNQDSFKKVKKEFSSLYKQIDEGTGFFSKFSQGISGSALVITDSIAGFGNSMIATGKHATTSAKVVSGTLGGIGTALEGSTKVGITALDTMVQGLNSVMGLALKSIGPAAILGGALAGLALLDGQMEGQIGSMIQTAITKGPEIITGLVQGIISKLPDLISSGTQLVAGLAEAISVNLPVIIQSGIALLQTLIAGVIANLPSLINSALLIIETLATSLLSAAPQILMMGLELLSALVDGLFQDPANLIETVTNIITTLTDQIKNNLPTIIEKGIEILVKLAEGIASTIPQLIPVALKAITTLVNTLIENMPKLLDAAVKIIGVLCDGLLSNLPQILGAAVELIVALVKGIGECIPKIIEAGAKIILKLVETVLKAVPDLLNVGKNLIKGLIDGIIGMGKGVLDAVKNIAKGIGDTFKSIFNIHSPSRWMRDEIGKMLPAGLAIGIERNAHVVDKPMDDLASKVILPSLDSLDQQVDTVQTLTIQSSTKQTQQKEKLPATFNIRLGNQQFKAFVSDISEAMGQDTAINLAF